MGLSQDHLPYRTGCDINGVACVLGSGSESSVTREGPTDGCGPNGNWDTLTVELNGGRENRTPFSARAVGLQDRPSRQRVALLIKSLLRLDPNRFPGPCGTFSRRSPVRPRASTVRPSMPPAPAIRSFIESRARAGVRSGSPGPGRGKPPRGVAGALVPREIDLPRQKEKPRAV